MLKIFVNDLERGEKFYHAVFGTNVVQRMGDNVRIMIFPGGTMPGIIMIRNRDEVKMKSSFVMQVQDVQATLALAAANGGVLLNTHFAQQVEGMPANSSHFDDPDGNNVEVLQIGGPSRK
jgi:predicted enzyme related to lactoylglutathione lyase